MEITKKLLSYKIKGSTQDFQKKYDTDSKKSIETTYKDDINLFDYSFSLE